MRNNGWWKDAIIYELYVDKFAGDFGGLTEKLDYFTDLGVDILWILPHFPSPMVDGGYDISDFRSVRSELGTMSDFEKFVCEAHEKKLKVIIDLVLNHTSDQHPWFVEARQSTDNPKRGWYMWDTNPDRMWEANVAFPDIKEKNWVANPQTGDYYYATFYPQQPDLNWDNPEVVSEMLAVMDFWMEKGIDGFRLDAIGRLMKRDYTNCYGLPETHAMLKKIRGHVDQKNQEIVLLAEAGGWMDEGIKFFGDGDECQLVMNFQLASNLVMDVIKPERHGAAEVWKQDQRVPEGCRWSVFLTNHDSVDLWFLSEEEQKEMIKTIDPDRSFSWQIGQSMAARLGEICRGDGDKIVAATKLLLDQPGVPIFYYGNEIGMRNEKLSTKPEDARVLVRGEFDWVEAEKQMRDSSSVVNRIKELIRMRKGQ